MKAGVNKQRIMVYKQRSYAHHRNGIGKQIWDNYMGGYGISISLIVFFRLFVYRKVNYTGSKMKWDRFA